MSDKAMNIDVSLVQRLIAAQFPQWARLRIRSVEFDGWDNRTFRLGDTMSVRLPSAERYAAQVEKEHTWLPRLGPLLPIAVPVPIAKGCPAEGHPWPWSVYRWIEGERAMHDRIDNLPRFAETLGQFLTSLQRIDSIGGPLPGLHNFHRGGPLKVYDDETRRAIATLKDSIETDAVTAVWDAAIDAVGDGPAVWVHGDVSASNLLVRDGRLHAVIDFGSCGVGDPACDLTIAWTFFSGESRHTFRGSVQADDAMWSRAGGWALWKGLITIIEHEKTDSSKAEQARQVIHDVLAEDQRTA